MYDLAIIGGGPAGATLARLVGKSMNTVLADKRCGNGEGKVCGGLLSPDAQKVLSKFEITLPKDILVDPQIFSVKTIDVPRGLVRNYQRFYLNLDRKAFDAWLISLVTDKVEIIDGRAASVSRLPDGTFEVTVHTGGERRLIHARYVCGCDGSHSIVRKTFFPQRDIRRYVAIQQRFQCGDINPFFSCIFDPSNGDCCSWSIFKNNEMIYGGAFPKDGCRERLERQKACVEKFGFDFSHLKSTEACLVSRPSSIGEIFTGDRSVFLAGEAAGFGSPSSREGISFAMESATALAEAMKSDDPGKSYRSGIGHLKKKIGVKLLKSAVLYNYFLRGVIMRSGIDSVDVVGEKQ